MATGEADLKRTMETIASESEPLADYLRSASCSGTPEQRIQASAGLLQWFAMQQLAVGCEVVRKELKRVAEAVETLAERESGR